MQQRRGEEKIFVLTDKLRNASGLVRDGLHVRPPTRK